MGNIFQSVLNWVYTNFKKDASKMLIWTGVAGWSLSSLAQICAIKFNPDIPKEQKSFLIPQEASDALVNILSFFLVTQVAKRSVAKMFSTGKITTDSVRDYLNKNKDKLKDKIGKFESDLDEVIKMDTNFPKESYWDAKNFFTTVATVGAGVVSSNIITPVIRNKMASNAQKKALNKETMTQISPPHNIGNNPNFKAYNLYANLYSPNLKI